MRKEFTIRKAEAADLASVNELLRQVLAVHHDGRPDLFNATGKKYTDAELLAIFGDPRTPVFVYEREGVVLGYAFCALRDEASGSLKPHRTLYLDDLCVHESARGQQIGAALFDYVKAFARKEGCYNITLHVWECNPGARAFYEHLGLQSQYTSMEFICSR